MAESGHVTPVLTSDWLVQVGLVLSDMAPNLSGNPGHDHEAITQLVYTVLRFSLHNAAPGSSLLTKTFNGSNHSKIIRDLERVYSSVRTVKPPSSRAESAEVFILAQNLKEIKKKT